MVFVACFIYRFWYEFDIVDIVLLQQPPTKRICLGGRGREWAAESLKLLETMSEVNDAKMFLEPMDPLKYAVSIDHRHCCHSWRVGSE